MTIIQLNFTMKNFLVKDVKEMWMPVDLTNVISRDKLQKRINKKATRFSNGLS